MREGQKIHVKLLGENVDVWRSVTAESIQDDIYQIANQPYDRDVEQWQFEPGDVVLCGLIEADGEEILAALELATS